MSRRTLRGVETAETAAQAVLDARAQCPTSALAGLYDPLTMPAPLLKAHQDLDRAADRCYRPEPFPSDRHWAEPGQRLFQGAFKAIAPLLHGSVPALVRLYPSCSAGAQMAY